MGKFQTEYSIRRDAMTIRVYNIIFTQSDYDVYEMVKSHNANDIDELSDNQIFEYLLKWHLIMTWCFLSRVFFQFSSAGKIHVKFRQSKIPVIAKGPYHLTALPVLICII